MARTNALLLALALETSAGDNRRQFRFRRPKTGFVATLVVQPEEYRLVGFVDTDEGIDLLWQYVGRPTLRRSG
jgi:hypothetical protein